MFPEDLAVRLGNGHAGQYFAAGKWLIVLQYQAVQQLRVADIAITVAAALRRVESKSTCRIKNAFAG
jgi:hypothetical protein